MKLNKNETEIYKILNYPTFKEYKKALKSSDNASDLQFASALLALMVDRTEDSLIWLVILKYLNQNKPDHAYDVISSIVEHITDKRERATIMMHIEKLISGEYK